jgi:hypothetical protein
MTCPCQSVLEVPRRRWTPIGQHEEVCEAATTLQHSQPRADDAPLFDGLRVSVDLRSARTPTTPPSLPHPAGSGSEGQNWSVKVPPSMRHFKFRGLTPGATYVVAVRACGVGGWGRRAAMRLTTPGACYRGGPICDVVPPRGGAVHVAEAVVSSTCKDRAARCIFESP